MFSKHRTFILLSIPNLRYMNRRTAIRNVIIITAGAGLLPSCAGGEDKASIALKHIPITPNQENMLAELAETIIPKTNNFVGAKELKAHEFVLMMVDDCSSPEEQHAFINGMKEFDAACEKKHQHSFLKCTPEQRSEWLKLMETKQPKQAVPKNAVLFYETTRRLTIQSFVSSKEYMIGVRNYKMVPGNHYKGCVPVKQTA
jgi:hypothetical protein